MTTEQLQTLTDDEVSMLWYIVNKLDDPVLVGTELNPTLFTSINKKSLIERVIKAESKITDEAKPIYSSLKTKMEITT